MIRFTKASSVCSYRLASRSPFQLIVNKFDIHNIAVNKPQGVSSADVIRTLQQHFNPSNLFKPWLDAENARLQRERNATKSWRKRRRNAQRLDVKIGHGGTLDPLATGVLVTGVGVGTKHLNGFLGCTKTYETVVLFGAETDTYDRLGKVVRHGPYGHITREAVEKALGQFRGNIMQRPPIFSALRFQGKRLYEYAREGKAPPVEIQARPVEVTNLEILEWYDPGTHDYKWPEQEMTGDEKIAAEELLDKDTNVPVTEGESAGGPDPSPTVDSSQQQSTKRKPSQRPIQEENTPADDTAATDSNPPSSKKPKTSATSTTTTTTTQQEDSTPVQQEATTPPPSEQEAAPTTSAESEQQPRPSPPSEASPPAVKITMTVSSGFYVRSLAHDLGKALGSCGLMSSLVRTRQADFSLGPEKVLQYTDLEAGEDVWGKKVQHFLEDWQARKMAEKEE